MKKKYINAALLFSIVSVNLTLAPAVLAEAAESVPESELIITETDAFTPEEIAEWEKETPKICRTRSEKL
ncbi:TPA: hypothetical protein ACGO4F_000125 [Streptococcus suis]